MSDDIIQHIVIRQTKQFEFNVTFPDLPGGVAIHTDESPPLGSANGPTPAALLGAAVGNCLAASLVFCLQKRRGRVDGMAADVKTRIGRNAAGRYRILGIDVELTPDVQMEEQDRLAFCESRYEDFCIVTESVRQGIPVNVTVRAAVGAAP